MYGNCTKISGYSFKMSNVNHGFKKVDIRLNLKFGRSQQSKNVRPSSNIFAKTSYSKNDEACQSKKHFSYLTVLKTIMGGGAVKSRYSQVVMLTALNT